MSSRGHARSYWRALSGNTHRRADHSNRETDVGLVRLRTLNAMLRSDNARACVRAAARFGSPATIGGCGTGRLAADHAGTGRRAAGAAATSSPRQTRAHRNLSGWQGATVGYVPRFDLKDGSKEFAPLTVCEGSGGRRESRWMCERTGRAVRSLFFPAVFTTACVCLEVRSLLFPGLVAPPALLSCWGWHRQ